MKSPHDNNINDITEITNARNVESQRIGNSTSATGQSRIPYESFFTYLRGKLQKP